MAINVTKNMSRKNPTKLQKTRYCRICGDKFTNASLHRVCSKCRQYNKCPSCGGQKQEASERCQRCAHVASRGNSKGIIHNGYKFLRRGSHPNAPQNKYVAEHRLLLLLY